MRSPASSTRSAAARSTTSCCGRSTACSSGAIRRVIDLSCRFSEHITLKRPLVSANMDTVTRAPMAIVQAEEGGLGIIDRGFRAGDIGPQVREVEKVKRTQHVIIRDPYAVVARDAARRRRRADAARAHGHARRRRRQPPAEGAADRARRPLRPGRSRARWPRG